MTLGLSYYVCTTYLKQKNTPVVFTTLYPHPISTSLFASPNGYQKLGSDNHASIMDGASVYHDPLPYL